MKYPCSDFGKRKNAYDKCENCPENIVVNCSIASLENFLPLHGVAGDPRRQIEINILRPDGKKLPALFMDKERKR